jgi:hypothetical protein
MKRPEGMSREAFALLGGSNPVIPTHLLGEQLHSSWNIDIDPAAQMHHNYRYWLAGHVSCAT